MTPNGRRDDGKLRSDRLSGGEPADGAGVRCRGAVVDVFVSKAAAESCVQFCGEQLSVIAFVALFPPWPWTKRNHITFLVQLCLTQTRFLASAELHSTPVEIPPDSFASGTFGDTQALIEQESRSQLSLGTEASHGGVCPSPVCCFWSNLPGREELDPVWNVYFNDRFEFQIGKTGVSEVIKKSGGWSRSFYYLCGRNPSRVSQSGS